MAQREYEPLTDDTHDMLFGPEDHDDPRPYRPTRADRRAAEHEHEHSSRRRSRRGWVIAVVTVVLAALVLVIGVPRIVDHFRVKDYSGNGAGYPTVVVTVHQGDSAADIASTLVSAGVVESSKAFTDAASSNTDSESIQPGQYDLHRHQSGSSAVAALLDPSSRNATDDVLVTEGETVVGVQARLSRVLGASQRTAIANALRKPANLNLPLTYTSGGKVPTSVEGFLYPATYTIEPGTSPVDALSKMVVRFIEADRTSGFAADAKALNVTPYQALIIASIIQAEAKFSDDMPKVAEVIYNRLHTSSPLQIDATTRYGCLLAGQKSCNYSSFATPYNSYVHSGLPPTPIDNPGAQAMDAAVHPATGKLRFYVNGDSAGHLAFFDNEKSFEQAVLRCRTNHWGCG